MKIFPFFLVRLPNYAYLCAVNQLTRHIEILLLNNDCVIVPDFGGFVAHWVPARYDEAERMFYPPMRTLGFNSQLRMNDSLLAQSYVEACDISYPEALRTIEHDVEEVKQRLADEGSFVLNGLGTLMVNMDGNYEFEPFQAGLLSPEIYGLPGLCFKRLRDEGFIPKEPVSIPVVPQQPQAESPALLDFTSEDEEEGNAVSIKMSWIRNAVAAAAAIVAFFVFATPIVNSDMGNQSMSQLQNSFLYKMMPKDTNETPVHTEMSHKAEKTVSEAEMKAATMESQQQVDEKAEAQNRNADIATKKTETTSDKTERVAQKSEPTAESNRHPVVAETAYYIVVASQVKRSNADDFVRQLHKQGYVEAEVLVHNNVVRVVCGEYKTEAEAYNRLNKLNDKEEFAEAWVFKKSI